MTCNQRILHASLALAVAIQILPVCSAKAHGQQAVLADFASLSPHELRVQAFTLTQPQTLQIHAVGLAPRDGNRTYRIGPFKWQSGDWNDENGWRGNAWIIDARTRTVVWDLAGAKTDSRDEYAAFDGAVQLPAGTYEAYYASYSGSERSSPTSWISTRARRTRYDDDGLSKGFRFTVRGAGAVLPAAALSRVREEFDRNTVVALRAIRRENTQRLGFTLDKATDLEMYVVGEGREREAFDYGWIINADTREKVWKFDSFRAEHAGGAEKNRVLRQTRTLPAGRYIAMFAADDSHDAGDWNAPPPYDPAYWGFTIRVKDPADRAHVNTFAYQSAALGDAIVALTGLHDNESRSYGFTLHKPLDLRVYALGEASNERMVDYGWIVDAKTHQRIWEMSYAQTEDAGGASKNRMTDRVLRLQPGSYIVSYVTDDSHSYGAWNASAPVDGEYWGITLLPASGKLDASVISRYDENADPNIIARLTKMRDGQERRVRFRMEKPGSVRVYALGEASGRELVDYGWIEDARTGKRVWSMEYGDTQHAGGARKNRIEERTLQLEAGEYMLRYRTDDSHAFADWNAEPPEDGGAWGITLYRVN